MKKIIFLLIVFIAFISCTKEETDPVMDCGQFKNGILAGNEDQVKAEIEKLCADLLPVVTASDEWGHGDNFITLTRRISQQCGINARVDCYACINTLPPQTEISISFTNNDVLEKKVLDISTSAGTKLTFLTMHD